MAAAHFQERAEYSRPLGLSLEMAGLVKENGHPDSRAWENRLYFWMGGASKSHCQGHGYRDGTITVIFANNLSYIHTPYF